MSVQTFQFTAHVIFLFKSVVGLTTKKSSNSALLALCEGTSTCHLWIPSQRDSNIESIYMSLCHHDIKACLSGDLCPWLHAYKAHGM